MVITVASMLSVLESKAMEAAGPEEEKFAASGGRWLGWVGVAIGAAMVLFDWRTGESPGPTVPLVGIAVAGLCWVILVRPRASAHKGGLLLQNMLRDIAIPWPLIESCQVGQTLVVTTKEAERFHGLGVSRSARSMMREEYGTTSILLGGRSVTGQKVKQETGPSMADGEFRGGTYTGYVESRIAGLASRGERGGDPVAGRAPVVSWAPFPIAILGVALAALIALALV
jgi:hypothetical protein